MSEAPSFRRDGACVVRQAVPDEVLRSIRAAIDSVVGTRELADLSALAGATEQPRFAAGVDHWRTHASFADLATSGILPRLVATVLGSSRLWLYEDSVLVKEPGTTVETRWHTDDGYFHVEGEDLATLWVPVDPAPLASGALRFLAGSHLQPTRYRPTLFVTDDAIPGTRGELPPSIQIDGPGVIGFDLELGDVTIHHARTLHAASGNSTDLPRRALSVRYCGDDAVVRVKPGAPPKPGFDPALDGTPVAEAATQLGLREAIVAPDLAD